MTLEEIANKHGNFLVNDDQAEGWWELEDVLADLKVHPLWREAATTLRQLAKELDSYKRVASKLDQEMQEIIERDKQMADLWFYGPASTPAMAYRDRRALLSYIRVLQTELAALREKRDTLLEWKRSMLEIEKTWDPQRVGRLLGIQLGASIRAGIEPAIVKMIEERDREDRLLCVAGAELSVVCRQGGTPMYQWMLTADDFALHPDRATAARMAEEKMK